jgi:hypothetical protein
MVNKSENLEITKELNVAALLQQVIVRQDEQLEAVVDSASALSELLFKGYYILRNAEIVSEAIANTAGNARTNRIFLKAINKLLRQEGRRYPYYPLTRKLRLQVLQAFNIAVSGHFVMWERIIQNEIIKVIGSKTLIDDQSVMSKGFMDRLKYLFGGKQQPEELLGEGQDYEHEY